MPYPRGPVLTDRDPLLLHWIGRHGFALSRQVGARWFRSDPRATTGEDAAYRRLQRLAQLGLVNPTPTRLGIVYRLTPRGSRTADLDHRPVHILDRELEHSIAVVDIMTALEALHPDAQWFTDRELGRALNWQQGRPISDHRPDGMFLFPGGSVAVEFDRTRKDNQRIEAIAWHHHRSEPRPDAVRWFVSPGLAPRYSAVIAASGMDGYVTVAPWPSDKPISPLWPAAE